MQSIRNIFTDNADNTVTVCTFNILDYNLAFNGIPKTMNRENRKKFDKILIETMSNIYFKDFHNGTERSGRDKNFMRLLWSAKVYSSDDLMNLRTKFSAVSNVSTEHISFDDTNKQLVVTNNKTITNLYLNLVEKFGQQKADELIDSIQEFNEKYCIWEVRGKVIAKKLVELNCDIIALQEFGSCYNMPLEIDNVQTTLPEYLRNNGYTSFFFLNPSYTNSQYANADGVGLFIKSSKFTVTKIGQASPATHSPKFDQQQEFIVDCNTEDDHIMRCFDIDEGTDVPRNNKRAGGIVMLTHNLTGKQLLILTGHFMTDSRDKNGSVKIAEIANFGYQVNRLIDNGHFNQNMHGIIFMGDFNTVLRNNQGEYYSDRNIFGASDGSVSLADVKLRDAFFTCNPNRISSINNDRAEWISYVFTNELLKPIDWIIEEIKPDTQMPGPNTNSECNTSYPSDHIPLCVKFELN